MERRKFKVTEEVARSSVAPYTTRIIKAGALLADTKTLLAHWDLSAATTDNIRRLQRENVFGKASRSRVEDILAIFRQRYAAEESVTKALVRLVQGRFPAADLDRILYFHAAGADRLLSAVVIFGKQAAAQEKAACEALGVKTLREYLRKPGIGGFWLDHVARYTKSRRKAPIYWLLQSKNKSFGLWVYYHRLDRDLLFKALQLSGSVQTKINLEQGHLDELYRRKKEVGDSGKEAKKVATAVSEQEDLLSELKDFAEKLEKAANLNFGDKSKLKSGVRYDPDLNDGIVLNIAPLHELVPWKEAKKYWTELMAGKHEWSSIGKLLRQKGLVKC